MFFLVSKLLIWFEQPLFFISLLFIASLLWKKQARKLFFTGFAMLFFFSNGFICNALMRLWEIPATPVSNIKTQYDYCIIMGGFTDLAQRPADRVYLTQAVDRMMHPLMLYRMGKVRKLLATGGNTFRDEEVTGSEAESVAKVLGYCNVPDSVILIEPKALNTRENANFTKTIIDTDWKGKGKPRILLVTSGFHMRRALACFNKAGLEVTGFSTDLRSKRVKWSGIIHLEPNAEALYTWRFLLHELLGILIYRLLGYC